MAKEFLLVDGYNIINAWKELVQLSKFSLESARLKLMDTLANYQGFKKNTVIVVFDAYLVKGNTRKVFKHNDIYVVYTKEAETADHYIEKVVHSLPKHYNVRVATSDNLEQCIILGQGATRISAAEFEREVKSVKKNIRSIIEKRPIKNNLLTDNLDPETREILEKMRRNL